MEIRVTDLCKAFGQRVIFNGMSAAFADGERAVVMGASGCGKTTLLRILMGFERPDSGEVTGVPERVSAVFQEDRLLENFSAASNVAFAAGKGTTERHIIRHLEEVGLDGSAKQSVSEMSGGMRRRVAIVRAMLARKGLLLLDEPLKGLDDHRRDLVAKYIKRQSEGVTTIIVTHDIDEAAMLGAALAHIEWQVISV